jgi:hypothetical protein
MLFMPQGETLNMATLLLVHVHKRHLLGSALIPVHLAGAGCVCLCLYNTADAYKRSCSQAHFGVHWTVRHRGWAAGVVPNCALSSRSKFAIMPYLDFPAAWTQV